MLKKISRNKMLRAIVLPMLKLINQDIRIKHQWTGEKIWLNLLKHKGYWFYGKKREYREMQIFRQIISQNEIVAEVGGHIGYLSLWFSELTQRGGHVYVFEPGDNNLPYLRRNTEKKTNIEIIEAGCGEIAGKREFFQDDLTGQNNSFIPDFAGLRANAEFASSINVTVRKRLVNMIRLDQFFYDKCLQPGFVKIDTEGYEWAVLKGCCGFFAEYKMKPKFMVEVQADKEEILQFFSVLGYKTYNSLGLQVSQVEQMRGNLFMLHPETHSAEIKRWLNL